MRYRVFLLLAASLYGSPMLATATLSRFCINNVTNAERLVQSTRPRRGYVTPAQLLTIYSRHRVDSSRPVASVGSTLDLEHEPLSVEIYDYDDPKYVARLKAIGGKIDLSNNGSCETVLGDTEGESFSIIGVKTGSREERAIALTTAEELSHVRFAQHFMFRLISSQDTVLFQNDKVRHLFDEFVAKYEAAREIRGAARPNSNILAQLIQNQGGMEQEFAYLFWAATAFFGKEIDRLSLEEICRAAGGISAKPLDRTGLPARLSFLAFHSGPWLALGSAPWYRFSED